MAKKLLCQSSFAIPRGTAPVRWHCHGCLDIAAVRCGGLKRLQPCIEPVPSKVGPGHPRCDLEVVLRAACSLAVSGAIRPVERGSENASKADGSEVPYGTLAAQCRFGDRNLALNW